MTSHNTTARPKPHEYADFYAHYVARVPEGDILEHLADQIPQFRAVLDPVSAETAEQIHAPYAWTIKQVVGHMIDVEKVFGYRAHRFASGDATPILGFDQDEYVANTDYHRVTLPQLTDELEFARRSNLLFLRRIAPQAWPRHGVADGTEISVRAIAFILLGHVLHHLDILRSRLSEA